MARQSGLQFSVRVSNEWTFVSLYYINYYDVTGMYYKVKQRQSQSQRFMQFSWSWSRSLSGTAMEIYRYLTIVLLAQQTVSIKYKYILYIYNIQLILFTAIDLYTAQPLHRGRKYSVFIFSRALPPNYIPLQMDYSDAKELYSYVLSKYAELQMKISGEPLG